MILWRTQKSGDGKGSVKITKNVKGCHEWWLGHVLNYKSDKLSDLPIKSLLTSNLWKLQVFNQYFAVFSYCQKHPIL